MIDGIYSFTWVKNHSRGIVGFYKNTDANTPKGDNKGRHDMKRAIGSFVSEGTIREDVGGTRERGGRADKGKLIRVAKSCGEFAKM